MFTKMTRGDLYGLELMESNNRHTGRALFAHKAGNVKPDMLCHSTTLSHAKRQVRMLNTAFESVRISC